MPDWSFQDRAVARCLRALEKGAGRKVGLVVPTGGGKTRIALRIAFDRLSKQSTGTVVWVTHRLNLRSQAHGELQRMLVDGVPGIPEQAAALLADRVDIIMLSQLAHRLAEDENRPLLLIVDEAHHAAAPSYQPAFETTYPMPGLFLTATPIRTDRLPIGVDEIAYTITYRELEALGAIILPEFEDFPVEDFEWSPDAIGELARGVLARARGDFVKTLVVAPRIDRVEEFHNALQEALTEEHGHPLEADDIGYVHSSGNSHGFESDDFLAAFRAKPRAIIVSAFMLVEGFNDPSLNTVVITYPSQSVLHLMQAAGRCVRYAPGKKKAYVVQARNDELAYHFDQRWLYQEISDWLRPSLLDVPYESKEALVESVRSLLQVHNVRPEVADRALRDLEDVAPGSTCRLMLSGLPYFGSPDGFEANAPWSAILETEANSSQFRWIFNDCCERGAEISDPTPLLKQHASRFGLASSHAPASDYRLYADLLTTMYRARSEVHADGSSSADGRHRLFRGTGPTTWLKYVTFHYEPVVGEALREFLEDCYNGDEAIAAYAAAPDKYALAIKLPVPMGPNQAFLLDHIATQSLRAVLAAAREALREVPPEQRVGAHASFVADAAPDGRIPVRVIQRLEGFLRDEDERARSLVLHVKEGG